MTAVNVAPAPKAEAVVDVVRIGGEEIREVIIDRRAWHDRPVGTRVALAELALTEREALEAMFDQYLRGPSGELLSREAGYLLTEREAQERTARAQAAARADEARAAEERAAYEGKWGPLLALGVDELRARIAIIDERRQRRREMFAEAEAVLAGAQTALRDLQVAHELDGGKVAAGAIAKAEARVSEAERNVKAKRVGFEAEVERTEEERLQLEAALPEAERREAAAAVDALRVTFEAVRRKQILAFIELLNVGVALADAHQELAAAAETIGQHAPTVITFGDPVALISWREYVRECGVDVTQDRTGRWIVTETGR